MKSAYDAIVVGAGPNGLAAAITLARQKLSVLLVEARKEVGGCVRSEALTLPGFVHDTCSSIFPMAAASPFFQSFNPAPFGLNWIQPDLPLVHPLDHGQAAILQRSVDLTAGGLGQDRKRYQAAMELFVPHSAALMAEVLGPMLHLPKHPLLLSKFGWRGLQSAHSYCRRHFESTPARALFAGLAAHSFLSLHEPASAAMGLVLNVTAHAVGWPMPRGGAGKIAEALAQCFAALGGAIQTGWQINNLDELPRARAILCDLSARRLLAIVGEKFPRRYRDALACFQMGPGVFKIDYALNAPIPWKNPEARRAGTLHVGGTLEEITASETATTRGEHAQKPFVLVAQHSCFDSSRAPSGKHTAWAYCHVPNASTFDMTTRMEEQIERFAPGFRDCILQRSARTCRHLELDNPNLIGGDINGGRANLAQLLKRPVLRFNPYQTPRRGLYLCSASTPPGGGVHGMCGYHAANHVLKDMFGI